MNERSKLRAAGEAVAAELGLAPPSGAPDLDRFALEAGFGAIWADGALALPDRMVSVLCALVHKGRTAHLAEHVAAALRIGLDAREIQEIIVQCGLYGGLPSAADALGVANAVFGKAGIEPVAAVAPERDLDALEADGRALLGELHGERGRAGYAAPGNPTAAGLYRYAILYGYGDIWHRPGLSHRRRMIVALASFSVLGPDATLRKFAGSALAMGLTREEIVAAVAQTAPYAGFPPALNALALLADVV